MRRVSAKRAALKGAREATVQAVLERDRHQCRAQQLVPEVRCWGPLDAHEVLTRARGGSITDPDNGIATCRSHHDWIHDHPVEAERLGLLAHSWDAA